MATFDRYRQQLSPTPFGIACAVAKRLGSVDIYAEHTMAPTRQMNDANRSASLS
jgi:hypothetical protein